MRALPILLGLSAVVALGASARASTSALSGEPYASLADVHPPVDLGTEWGASRPGTEALRDWVLRTRGGSDVGIWPSAAHGETSLHQTGRAWDWGVPSKAAGDAFVRALMRNRHELARRAGVIQIIWDRKIRTSYPMKVQGGGWSRPFEPRPYTGSDPHTSHVHVSLTKQGAMGETSAYTGGLIA